MLLQNYDIVIFMSKGNFTKHKGLKGMLLKIRVLKRHLSLNRSNSIHLFTSIKRSL